MNRKLYRNRVIFAFWIDKANKGLLMEYIENKYMGQSKHGAISNEVNAAINVWLHGHKDTKNYMNPSPQVEIVWRSVKKYIIENFYCTQQASLYMIQEAIKKVRGADQRTVQKWIESFHKWKLIKEIAPEVWEIM